MLNIWSDELRNVNIVLVWGGDKVMGLLSFGRKHCCEDNGDLCEEKAF